MAGAPVSPIVAPAEVTFEAGEDLHMHHIHDQEMLEGKRLCPWRKKYTLISLQYRSLPLQVSTEHLPQFYSSCSTIFIDDSTASRPHLTMTLNSQQKHFLLTFH
uniref:cyclin-Y-like protein 2 n=1 Tax=Callithrix jacchus TaxID=9483 RepID=UPI0023DD1625|nr:cyclin-Y-like protein 2 [Callithrix jacchus]